MCTTLTCICKSTFGVQMPVNRGVHVALVNRRACSSSRCRSLSSFYAYNCMNEIGQFYVCVCVRVHVSVTLVRVRSECSALREDFCGFIRANAQAHA